MTDSSQHADFVLDLAARPDLLCVIRAALAAWCERAGLETTKADQVCLAVDEATTNIIRHAYAGQQGRIRLTCSRRTGTTGRCMLMTLEDDGQQVPLHTICSRDLDDVKPGGLGVHLIQQVMDEVIYSHRPTGGTVLSMRVDIEQTPSTSQQGDAAHA
jgi:anti-sigma regulatory factor (Ser/Thr protein kinase)